MELQFHKIPVSYLSCQLDSVENKELTQEIRLPDGMPDIGRVITTWAQVQLRSKERYPGSVTVSGGVMAHILYMPEGEQEARVTECWMPFQHKWEIPDAEDDGPVRVYPIVRFADSRGISARKLIVRVGVGILLQAFAPVCQEIPSPPEAPGDVQILKEFYPLSLIRNVGEKHFHLDEDMVIPDMSEEDKLLCARVIPEITDTGITGNRIVFRGNGQVHLIFRKEDGKIAFRHIKLPFSQYGELPASFSSDARADILGAVTNLETDVVEPGKIRLKCSMVCQYRIIDRQLIEVGVDAYSPQRELQMQREDRVFPVILDQRQEILRAEQSIPGLAGIPADGSILPDFPRQYRSDVGVELELAGVFQILSCSDEGNLQGSNVRWEAKLDLPADVKSGIRIIPSTDGIPVCAPGTDGMTVTGNVLLDMTVNTEQPISMLSGMELGEIRQRDTDRPSLILCRVTEENLWQIAKRAGSTVEKIRETNGLAGEPQKGQMLLIPVL